MREGGGRKKILLDSVWGSLQLCHFAAFSPPFLLFFFSSYFPLYFPLFLFPFFLFPLFKKGPRLLENQSAGSSSLQATMSSVSTTLEIGALSLEC